MHAQVYSTDEELGKRDDNFRPKRSPATSNLFQPWRWRKRRLFAVLAVTLLVYVFVHNIPTDLGTIDQRMGRALRPGHTVAAPGRAVSTREPDGPPPRPIGQRDGEGGNHYYNGPIRFYKLAESLHGIAHTQGNRPQNRNVLFAVSSLQSAANLMPMACEMAKWSRNHAHMILFGQDPLSLEDVLAINGVSTDDCAVFFHDARADYSGFSTDVRAEASVAGAMKHINDFMHPQAIIMDDSMVEDYWFTRALRSQAQELGRALIEVPAGRYEEFFWLTRLDSGSLSNWFKPNIDIVIHAPPKSSGGLIRLVKSLENADYSGLKVPRLNIELPNDTEESVRQYLERLEWPPIADPSPVKQSTLVLRHRIPSSRLSSEQASVRFLESFYPTSVANNHVLVLSSQAEVSPLFLQYLHYAILEFRYSSYGSPGSEDLLGISLDVPFAALNGSGTFTPPTIADMHTRSFQDASFYDQSAASPFLYQAPSATASLIFGNNWATLHDFLANRLAASHSGKAEKTPKLVSETEPAWLEYLLELVRTRGWSMLHPPVPFVTVHNELSHIPEEYTRENRRGAKATEPPTQSDNPDEEAFLTAPEPPVIIPHTERQPPLTQPLHELLPFEGDLPELPHLPYVFHTGELINATTATALKTEYLPLFRRQIGGCEGHEGSRKRIVRDLKTDDLFCLPGVEMEFEMVFETVPQEQEVEVAKVVQKPGGTVLQGYSRLGQSNVDPDFQAERARLPPVAMSGGGEEAVPEAVTNRVGMTDG